MRPLFWGRNHQKKWLKVWPTSISICLTLIQDRKALSRTLNPKSKSIASSTNSEWAILPEICLHSTYFKEIARLISHLIKILPRSTKLCNCQEKSKTWTKLRKPFFTKSRGDSKDCNRLRTSNKDLLKRAVIKAKIFKIGPKVKMTTKLKKCFIWRMLFSSLIKAKVEEWVNMRAWRLLPTWGPLTRNLQVSFPSILLR